MRKNPADLPFGEPSQLTLASSSTATIFKQEIKGGGSKKQEAKKQPDLQPTQQRLPLVRIRREDHARPLQILPLAVVHTQRALHDPLRLGVDCIRHHEMPYIPNISASGVLHRALPETPRHVRRHLDGRQFLGPRRASPEPGGLRLRRLARDEVHGAGPWIHADGEFRVGDLHERRSVELGVGKKNGAVEGEGAGPCTPPCTPCTAGPGGPKESAG